MSESRPTVDLTRYGVPGIGKVPFGTHVCHFRRVREDLIDTLAPYFAAGLRNNERCVWVTPFPAD
ncbi:MAG TPA: MEDS domain-containing protein, partial [Edaphobacter sp.]